MDSGHQSKYGSWTGHHATKKLDLNGSGVDSTVDTRHQEPKI